MPATQENWIVEMLVPLPDDGQRYELIDGVLYVTPAPPNFHQIVAGEFFGHLREYLAARESCGPAVLARRRPARRQDT